MVNRGNAKTIGFYLSSDLAESVKLEGNDVKILVLKGRGLFEKLMITDDAATYLDENPDLMEVIEKW